MDQTFRWTGEGRVYIIGDNAVIRHGRVDKIHGHYVTEGQYDGGTMMFRFGSSSRPFSGELVFGGFIFDWDWHENAGMRGVHAIVDSNFETRNIRFKGTHSLGSHGNIRAATMSPDSFGIVDSIDMRGGGLHFRDTINTRRTRRYEYDPSIQFGQSWGTTGVAGHPDQEGTTLYQNIFSGAWPDNNIYCGQGERGEWYDENLEELQSRLADVDDREEYREVREWLESEAPEEARGRRRLDHVPGLLEQLSREPLERPTIEVDDVSIDDISYDDIELQNYKSHRDRVRRRRVNSPPTIIPV